MNYSQKYFEEIFEQMLNDSVDNGLISRADEFIDWIDNQKDISNYYVMDKAVIARMFEKVYEDITRIYESAKIEYAEGIDLDDIGRIVGIPRPTATKASVEVTFTLKESWEAFENDINLSEGIVVSTEDGIKYVTVEELYLSKDNDTSVKVQCLSVESNMDVKISKNSIVNIDSNIGYDFSVTNEKASSGGEDAFTDDEYRYLLINWIKIYIKGSIEAYENYFANFDGIDGYKLVPNWDGSGTMKIILDPGTPYLLNKAYNEIKDTICQADEIIMMFAPVEKTIDVYIQVNVDIDQINPYSEVEKTDIQNKILQAINVFIDGGYMVDGNYYPGLLIGEDFIPHKLAVFLDDEVQELKNITFTTPEDYIKITDEEIGVSGNLTVEMI